MATLQVTSLAGTGRCYTDYKVDWATARGASSSDNADALTALVVAKSGTTYTVGRFFCPFDTSALTAAATITGATLDFYRLDAEQAFQNQDTTTLEVVVTTQASTTALDVSDFSKVTFASKGSLALASTASGQYNSITITDTSIINKTGNTLLGIVTGNDLANSAPLVGATTIGSANTHARLTITYTLPATGGFFLHMI